MAPTSTPTPRPPAASKEQTKLVTAMHWAVFARPGVWLLIGVLLKIGGIGLGTLFLVIGIGDAIGRALLRTHTQYEITTRRLVMSTGILRKRSLELALPKLESIAVDQTLVGRLLGYGTVVVGGTGGTKEAFPLVPAPQTFRQTVQELAA
ncbi:MAG TPA: PH domain-containing protein [Gemmatimonadales bacterium]|nr:PH domain-containing protein [Gemmatimonadales bacterium]